MAHAPGTLGWLIENDFSMHGYCHACGHRQIDLAALIERLGAGRRYVGARKPVKCGGCGGALQTFISPNWTPTGRYPRHGEAASPPPEET
ncbi:hypothetical protein [Chelatococcus reniformis]|uniref:Uncharacterized protein n=1 Tax=Chelatococcus reniformis TaxID=1494448 RepID=A0A916UFJ6_9HYPH|nr:hypothetical protein [Chelatococcus reniformis]GGC71101.1 hypothetical protein GCM10010994_32000 [Chelatococcus reniformis]